MTNLCWLASERLTQLAVAIVISGLLARHFGPDLFGKWQYASTLLSVVTPLTWICGAEILVPTTVTALREGEDGRRSGPRLGAILGSAFVLRFGASVLALAVVWCVLGMTSVSGVLFAHWDTHFARTLTASSVWGAAQSVAVKLRPDPQVAAMFAGLAATMLFREPFGVVATWLQARTYSKPALLLSLACAVLKAAALTLLIRMAIPAGVLGWVWTAESAIIAAGLLLYYRHYANAAPGRYVASTAASALAANADTVDAPAAIPRDDYRWRVDIDLLKRFTRSGAVFWIGLVCMYLFLKMDRLILKHYVDYATLGRYAAAQQINENWITVALMLAQTVGPAFIYRVADAAAVRRNFYRLLALTAVAMSLGAAVLSTCSPFVIHAIFGPGFDQAANFLSWSAWLGVLAGLEAIANLIALKFQAKRLVLAKWLGALLCSLIVDIWLIPTMGGYGAMLGIAAGYLVALCADLIFARRAIAAMGAVSTKTPAARAAP